jgi:hypothetical protein
MRRFGQFVKPDAKRVLTSGTEGDELSFVDPDGSTVIVVGSSGARPYALCALGMPWRHPEPHLRKPRPPHKGIQGLELAGMSVGSGGRRSRLFPPGALLNPAAFSCK